MNILFEEYHQLLSALIKFKVDFMLVGGYAVIHYGYQRTTGDMDIWLKLGNANKEKLLMALEEFGIETGDVDMLKETDFSDSLPIFFIGEKPKRIDFITKISRIRFEDAIENVVYVDLENVKVPVIHLNDLIISKSNTGRAQDLADIEELKRIDKYRS